MHSAQIYTNIFPESLNIDIFLFINNYVVNTERMVHRMPWTLFNLHKSLQQWLLYTLSTRDSQSIRVFLNQNDPILLLRTRNIYINCKRMIQCHPEVLTSAMLLLNPILEQKRFLLFSKLQQYCVFCLHCLYLLCYSLHCLYRM